MRVLKYFRDGNGSQRRCWLLDQMSSSAGPFYILPTHVRLVVASTADYSRITVFNVSVNVCITVDSTVMTCGRGCETICASLGGINSLDDAMQKKLPVLVGMLYFAVTHACARDI